MTVRELRDILNTYDANGGGKREVVMLRKRTKKIWYGESVDKALDGNDSALFMCADEFADKVVLE